MAAASAGSGPHSDDIGDLILQIADLRRRVLNLEQQAGIMPAPSIVPAPAPSPVTSAALAPGIVPVLGRMVIAIAGAYVLRALTEWGVLAAPVGVTLGLSYGLVWLFIAARSHTNGLAAKFVTVVNCCTSVLIVAPLVWEATLNLKVLSSAISAAVLSGFSLIALWLAWKTSRKVISAIASSASIVVLIALLIARDDIVPFTAALLAIAAASEFAAWRDFQPGARAFAAISADWSVLLFSWLASRPGGMPESWVPVSPSAIMAAETALALIYIATAAVQTIARRRTLSFPEMIQTGAALLIGIGGEVWVFHDHHAAMLALGFAALAGGIACYAVSFAMFEHENKWNFRAWSAFGLLLALAGISLPFSRTGFWILCITGAAFCCWTARQFRLPTLGLHGAVYLAAGAAAAGVIRQSWLVLFGAASAPGPREAIAVMAAGIISWAAIARLSSDGDARWRNQATSLVIAGNVVWIAAGLAASVVRGIWQAAAGEKNRGPADTLATVVLIGLSLVLARLATQWDRREFTWLLSGLMALCAYKLAVRDFTAEHNLALVISLSCYGGALILLPRLLRTRPADS